VTAVSKWLPVIETDACLGCRLCREACPAKCIEMVWDFATLARPDDCTSCGSCARACPHDVIRMDWRSCIGDPAVGCWRPAPPAANTPGATGLRTWFKGIASAFGRTGL